MNGTMLRRSSARVPTGLSGRYSSRFWGFDIADTRRHSAASDMHTGEGVAIKKVTNVFSKKILAKRALREIKLLQHFRGHRNVSRQSSCVFCRC